MVIDMYNRPPLRAFSVASASRENYARIFGRQTPGSAFVEEELEQHLARLDELGVTRAVVHALDARRTIGVHIANETVAEFCKAHGPRFIGFAAVDPFRGMSALAELRHAITDLGLRGLNISCFELEMAIDDPRLYPVYAACIELDVPVTLHAGYNMSSSLAASYSLPLMLDRVMMHFPDLRVHVAPPAWPWVLELIGVAQRHQGVFLGTAAVRPKYFAVAGSGYEPLLQYGRTRLKDRILFGSAFPLIPVEDAVADVRQLQLPDDVSRRWLVDNATRFLRLSQEARG